MWAEPIYAGDGDGRGNGSGDGAGYGDGRGNGAGAGRGDGRGHGDGDGYGYAHLAGGRLYKLVKPDRTTHGGFLWPTEGPVNVPGPYNENPTEPCPRLPGDGLCVGLTRPALTSGGLTFAPPNRLLLVETDPNDFLGSADGKLRTRRAVVVREATFEEWSEVPK